MALFQKLRGGGVKPPRPSLPVILFSATAAGLTIAALTAVGDFTQVAILSAPLGASALLVFGYPDSPLAQPRNVVGGHLIAAVIALTISQTLPADPIAYGLALGLSMAAMMITRTLHPPAGSMPLLIAMNHADWWFLVTPVLTGSVAIVGLGLVINNLSRSRRYPHYWR